MKTCLPTRVIVGPSDAAWHSPAVGAVGATETLQLLPATLKHDEVVLSLHRDRPDVIVAAADLRGLDADAVHAAEASGAAIVAVARNAVSDDAARARAIGIRWVLRSNFETGELVSAIEAAHGEQAGRRMLASSAGSECRLAGSECRSGAVARPGTVLAIWGSKGAPGRTTVAISLARALAGTSRPVLLVDADVYGADVAQTLGISSAPSIANASHRANRGELPGGLTALTTQVCEGLDVLPGLPRVDLWPELRESPIRLLLQAARQAFRITIVDVAFCIEDDEELNFDRIPFRRNGATRTVLSSADHIVAVCRADPVGARSLAAAMHDAFDDLCLEPSQISVVANRVPARSSARRSSKIRTEVHRKTGLDVAAMLSEDPAVVSALWAARPIQDHAPRARFARQIGELATGLSGLGPRQEFV